MSLEFYVPKTHAKPGAFISGSICLRSDDDADFDIQTLSVTLLGLSKTRVVTGNGPSRKYHQSRAIFFEIQKQLCQGSLALQSGYRTQFDFQFPEGFRNGGRTTELAKADDELELLFEKPKAQVLPPFGEFGAGNSITYSLEASLIGENCHSEITASMTLEFCQTRREMSPGPQSVTIFQEKVLANQDNSELDQSCFRLALDTPQIVIQDQAIPLTLRVLYSKLPTLSSPPPTILLKFCRVQLLASTAIQCENNTQDRWTDVHTIAIHDSSSLESNAGTPSVTTQGLDLGVLLEDLRIPLHIAPTFECTNIQRTYALKVSLGVDYAGELVDLTFDVGAVTILAAEYVGDERAKEEAMGFKYWVGKDPRSVGLYVHDDFI